MRSATGALPKPLRVLGRLLDGPDGDVQQMAAAVDHAHLRQLAVAQHVAEHGGGPKDIARELGLRSEFVARKLSRQAARWTPEQLSGAIIRIASVERETRGEGVLPRPLLRSSARSPRRSGPGR